MKRIAVALLTGSLVLAGCRTTPTASVTLDYLGSHTVAQGTTVNGAAVGGLTGISYDAERDVFYLAGRAGSASAAPTRFYVARMQLWHAGVQSLEFLESHPWSTFAGAPMDSRNIDAMRWVFPPQAEGIAVDARRQRLYWSSEGERIVNGSDPAVLLDPAVRIADLDGRTMGTFTLPANLRMVPGGRGPRPDRTLTGLGLTPDGRWLWAAMEGPLHEDGPPPSAGRGALSRVTQLDPETGSATAQYAYPLDPLTGADFDNGLADLVAFDDSQFLVLERGSGARNSARVYHAQVDDAENVLDRPSLNGAAVRPMTKTLLTDLTAAAGLAPGGNVEGIALGPALPDGRRTVVLVTPGAQVMTFAMSDCRCQVTPRHIRSYGMPEFLMPQSPRSQGETTCHTHRTRSEAPQAPGR
ncbi:esterase-like activity of phytase family protein [Mycolicibacterium goodii]|uniref:esterase-like activity of phytase family protein n=1 Tax=Mycolicibacterium goodii TaxID=134601 RepID=UPI002579B202|nr:esterase-like activity of phytase family protein [Mycolicibacterium goodii]